MNSKNASNTSNEPYVIKYSTFTDTKLIDENEQFSKSVNVKWALDKAKKLGLDLVCFNRPEKGQLALCKIINFGKWKYHSEKEAKRKINIQKRSNKEIRFSMHIEKNDIDHKVKQIREFIDDGCEVAIGMMVKGRDRGHMDVAESKYNEIVALCKSFGQEINRRVSGPTITSRIIPTK